MIGIASPLCAQASSPIASASDIAFRKCCRELMLNSFSRKTNMQSVTSVTWRVFDGSPYPLRAQTIHSG